MSQSSKPSRDYVLLTGGTGFLGQYLLRDFLAAGQNIAVIARSSAKSSASARIDDLLTSWETRLGVHFLRPKVICWDIASDEQTFPSRDDKEWIQANVGSILHAAASVRFTQDLKTGEPSRTNLNGTRNVCALARELGGVDFHYVSTAYVCGEKSGRVSEVLHQPLRFRNGYEQSKHAAEHLLTEHRPDLKSLTIYRPSIIVGDSRTGFASTFQTVYSGLRLAVAWPGQAENASVASIMSALQLTGNETKNIVPVDWVSSTILSIFANEDAHDTIYHLTNPIAVPIGHLTESMVGAANLEPKIWQELKSTSAGSEALPEIQRVFLDSFQEYFCADPYFDCTNLSRVLPNTGFRLDRNSLRKMFQFAIRMRFRDAEGQWEQVSRCEATSPFPWELRVVSSKGITITRFLGDNENADIPTIVVQEDVLSKLAKQKYPECTAMRHAELIVIAEPEQRQPLLQCFRVHAQRLQQSSMTLHELAVSTTPLKQGVV